jgi:hypothetical protein
VPRLCCRYSASTLLSFQCSQCKFYHQRALSWLRAVPERRPSIRRERASARRA